MAVGRPVRVPWQEDAATLGQIYRLEQDYQIRPRLQALWLIRQGQSVRAASAVIGVHERTVQDWLAWYRLGGLAAVRGHRRAGRGRTSFLTAEQQAQLLAQAATGAFYTAQDACDWVAQQFGVHYRLKGMYRLLARLRVHPKVPRPFNPKSSPEAQDAWKRGACAPR